MRESRWLTALERAVLVLFVLLLAAAGIRLAGWRPDWWLVGWQLCGIAFIVTLLMYLNADGVERVVRSKVGLAGLMLLGLSALGNVVRAFFGIGSPVLEVARDTVTVAFMVCFVTYVVIRYRQHRSSQVTRSH